MSGSSISRRAVLRGMVAAGAVATGAAACSSAEDGADEPAGRATGRPEGGTAAPAGRRFGAEWEKHERTLMSWPASAGIRGKDLREDVARVARAIAEFEPVVLLTRPGQEDAARKACGSLVEVAAVPVDGLWARDTAAVCVEDAGALLGIDFNFNGWGDKQTHANDGKVAAAVPARYNLARFQAPLVAEGGSFETDGAGTLMVTESSIVNANRNPGRNRAQLEEEPKRTLGVTQVVWFAGVRGEDITDAHVDSLVRFAAPGVVLLDTPFPCMPADSWSRSADRARAVPKDAVDARGKAFEVIDLPQPDPDRITGRGDTFLSTYANFYIANGAVLIPEFGDPEADDRAKRMPADHFPGREVVAVPIDGIASGGGGIHCSTHDVPAAPAAR
ncbi:peptidyl-arginine deiminase [Embleya scabrispora]|uniref:Peptidyl-arginine deiminase n=1 Tax=Embleya scabrispora TaxID=159449 RepID=A0A1T3NI85_9ACTN|nr:agmatine deiminase family protein [Embleya scabrispora]OPC76596.1 peptidyl-arginine deiminase [Embleya scabrispora]